ncbi:PH-protein kinase domain containing protein, partial [Reticulomyxa filosa]
SDDPRDRLFSKGVLKSEKIKEGYMTKQGGSIKTWRRRYFVLYADGQMYYFKQKDKQDLAKGSVDLSTTYRLVKLASHHEFHVSTRERTWCFRADNEVEKSEWLDTISQLTKLKRKTLAQQPSEQKHPLQPSVSTTTLSTDPMSPRPIAQANKIKKYDNLAVSKEASKSSSQLSKQKLDPKKNRRVASDQLNGIRQEEK